MNLEDQLREELHAVAAAVEIPAVPLMSASRRPRVVPALLATASVAAVVAGLVIALDLREIREDPRQVGASDHVSVYAAPGPPPTNGRGRRWAQTRFGDRYAGMYLERLVRGGPATMVVAVKDLTLTDCRAVEQDPDRPGGLELRSARYSENELDRFKGLLAASNEAVNVWVDPVRNRVELAWADAGSLERFHLSTHGAAPQDAIVVVDRIDTWTASERAPTERAGCPATATCRAPRS